MMSPSAIVERIFLAGMLINVRSGISLMYQVNENLTYYLSDFYILENTNKSMNCSRVIENSKPASLDDEHLRNVFLDVVASHRGRRARAGYGSPLLTPRENKNDEWVYIGQNYVGGPIAAQKTCRSDGGYLTYVGRSRKFYQWLWNMHDDKFINYRQYPVISCHSNTYCYRGAKLNRTACETADCCYKRDPVLKTHSCVIHSDQVLCPEYGSKLHELCNPDKEFNETTCTDDWKCCWQNPLNTTKEYGNCYEGYGLNIWFGAISEVGQDVSHFYRTDKDRLKAIIRQPKPRVDICWVRSIRLIGAGNKWIDAGTPCEVTFNGTYLCGFIELRVNVAIRAQVGEDHFYTEDRRKLDRRPKGSNACLAISYLYTPNGEWKREVRRCNDLRRGYFVCKKDTETPRAYAKQKKSLYYIRGIQVLDGIEATLRCKEDNALLAKMSDQSIMNELRTKALEFFGNTTKQVLANAFRVHYHKDLTIALLSRRRSFCSQFGAFGGRIISVNTLNNMVEALEPFKHGRIGLYVSLGATSQDGHFLFTWDDYSEEWADFNIIFPRWRERCFKLFYYWEGSSWKFITRHCRYKYANPFPLCQFATLRLYYGAQSPDGTKFWFWPNGERINKPGIYVNTTESVCKQMTMVFKNNTWFYEAVLCNTSGKTGQRGIVVCQDEKTASLTSTTTTSSSSTRLPTKESTNTSSGESVVLQNEDAAMMQQAERTVFGASVSGGILVSIVALAGFLIHLRRKDRKPRSDADNISQSANIPLQSDRAQQDKSQQNKKSSENQLQPKISEDVGGYSALDFEEALSDV